MNYEEMMRSDGRSAMSYLENKYGNEFIPISYDISDYQSDKDEVECYVEGMNPEEEHVTVFIDRENENTMFHDNYFGFLVQKGIEDHIAEIVEMEFSDCKVFETVENRPYPDGLTQENTLSDLYREEPGHEIWSSVYIKGDSEYDKRLYGQRIDLIAKRLKEDGYIYMIQIFVVNETLFHSIERFHQEPLMDHYTDPDNVDEQLIYIYDAGISKEGIKVYGRTK